MTAEKTVYLAEPMGFCGGVRRAMQLFEKTVAEYPGQTVYVLHELVHNRTVSDEMRKNNACFVESLDEVPDGAVVVFGAHGIGTSVEDEARRRKLIYCDAVCPLVSKLQNVAASAGKDASLIFLGDRNHPEVKSVLERAVAEKVFMLDGIEDLDDLPALENAIFLCQTTRNAGEVETVAGELALRIPGLVNMSQVCDAVSRRQQTMAEISSKCDLVLVVGSPHSSNGKRLLAVAEERCHRAEMVEGAEDLTAGMLEGVRSIGIGSATSTSDKAIDSVLKKLEENGFYIN